ncbi:MAG: hypothetical protein JRG69_01825 [Deltaproteobacteria bacterium]|nr:hypothetical protein [Deltaproteobacteria bacterium]
MKVVRLFRTLAFQPEGKDMVRGPEARGTLAIIDPANVVDGYKVRFIRDKDKSIVEMEIDSFDVIDALPNNKNVVLVLPDKKMHTFVAYRELPAEGVDLTQFTIISAGVNPTARYET